jgi:hypothetical protein
MHLSPPDYAGEHILAESSRQNKTAAAKQTNDAKNKTAPGRNRRGHCYFV